MSIEEFLSQSLMQSSIKTYIYDIEKYKKHDKNVAKYDYQKVMKYIEILRHTHAISYIQKIIASIKKYYDYLISRVIISSSAKSCYKSYSCFLPVDKSSVTMFATLVYIYPSLKEVGFGI